MSVSYTHLDVYKRQLHIPAIPLQGLFFMTLSKKNIVVALLAFSMWFVGSFAPNDAPKMSKAKLGE